MVDALHPQIQLERFLIIIVASAHSQFFKGFLNDPVYFLEQGDVPSICWEDIAPFKILPEPRYYWNGSS